MTAFWHVKPQEFINDELSNFANFPNAFLTLFKGSTGESWNALMHELMQRPDSLYDERCADNVDPTLDTCGMPGFAVLYMLSFQTIVSMVILNICVAVVLEHFEEQRHERERELQLEKFKRIWARYARACRLTLITCREPSGRTRALAQASCSPLSWRARRSPDALS